jgi:anaerobic ribonucleoside-triphosphate reductase activating protein
MLVHAKISLSETNGPGKRAVIWTKGCLLRCPGCFNPETWDVPNLGTVFWFWESTESLTRWIISAKSEVGIVGLTLSGGEPIHQISYVIELCQEVKAKCPDFSVGMFTGYTPAELNEGDYQIFMVNTTFNPTYGADVSIEGVSLTSVDKEFKKAKWLQLQQYLDFAIMGRYIESKKSKCPYLGSSNREIVLFSPRYKLEDFGAERQAEVIMEPAGLTQITEFPDLDLSREI